MSRTALLFVLAVTPVLAVHAAWTTLEPPGLDSPASPPKIFYIGLPKTGTTSFAAFMWQTLNVSKVLHANMATTAIWPDVYNQSATWHTGGNFPDYEQWRFQLNGTLLDRVLTSEIGAFADMPWPTLFPMIMRRVPDARFVIWDRPVDEWVVSITNYFCGNQTDSDDSEGRGCQDWLITYGDSHAWCLASEERRTTELTHVYERHTEAISKAFNATPEKASRLLRIDMLADHAGFTLCEFVYGSGWPGCAGVLGIPETTANDLPEALASEAVRTLKEAVCAGEEGCLDEGRPANLDSDTPNLDKVEFSCG